MGHLARLEWEGLNVDDYVIIVWKEVACLVGPFDIQLTQLYTHVPDIFIEVYDIEANITAVMLFDRDISHSDYGFPRFSTKKKIVFINKKLISCFDIIFFKCPYLSGLVIIQFPKYLPSYAYNV